MSDTIFDKIVRREIDSHIVWENDDYIAFLTPFPNTPGFTVVIPKTNIGDNVFSLNEDEYLSLMSATKTVANLLEKALSVNRVALVFEGTGVAYVHAKLIPLYGQLADETDVWSDTTEFVEEYRGFITTLEGPKMDDSRLDEIRNKIVGAQSHD
ncbi:MAG: diadenosine tetraphosphate hydrolase [Subtercola sp.]|nr:diadenosine tetraphosphate hydrolase [Subtercola sp.]